MSSRATAPWRAATLPNLISIARLVAVPFFAWLLLTEQWKLAFWLFVLAGASDAVDGILARRFGWQSTLGAWLDPLADKALLVAAFVLLAMVGLVPVWLAILVIARDVLIMAGVLVLQLAGRATPIRPLMISKINTVFQITFVTLVMAGAAYGWAIAGAITSGAVLTAGLTIASLAAYARVWFDAMTRERHAHDG